MRYRHLTLAIALLIALCDASAQDIPLVSAGAGFVTNTTGGNTTYIPLIEPVTAIPLGERMLIESRASLIEFFSPDAHGYSTSHYAALAYLSGDYIANAHLTVVGGSYLIPFGTYNERLTPIWIGNFQDEPLMEPLGLMSGGTGLGGQLRGSAIHRARYSADYAAWYSTTSGNEQFKANRSAGGRGSFYFPELRLEIGGSYGRLLRGAHENFIGTHLWWQTPQSGFRFRSEAARGEHAYGYWVEADWHPGISRGDSFLGGFEPVFRMQQTFRINNSIGDGLPGANTQRVDFGLDYDMPHNTRILTSYSRQFASTGNVNIWETGIVYRFLIPAWKGHAQ